ncbi:MAG: N-acetylmuramoyl-L-alanine amidase [Rikenellaceae bacterium]
MKNHFLFRAITTLFFALVLTTAASERASAQGVKVIVIDPGHGGKFPGAVYGGHSEKDINLKVAMRLGEMIKKGHPKVKVIYTRTKDVALGETLSADLSARSRIANEAGGDIFISIHANAAKNPETVGVETLIMGMSTLERQRNDAALYAANEEHLIDMSNEKDAAMVRAYIQNLQFTYGQYSEALARLIQKNYGSFGRTLRPVRGQPLAVLYGTDMPCVLTEIGFMTNKTELAYITSDKGMGEIVKSIYGGIDDYINMVSRTSNSVQTSKPTVDPAAEIAETATTDTKVTTAEVKKIGYTVQIFSSNTILADNDSQFKSYVGKQFILNSTGRFKYKYCIGKHDSYDEAQKTLATIRKTFKDAFITTY